MHLFFLTDSVIRVSSPHVLKESTKTNKTIAPLFTLFVNISNPNAMQLITNQSYARVLRVGM